MVQIQLHEEYEESIEELKEKIRAKLHTVMPEIKLSFEPIQLTDKILSRKFAHANRNPSFGQKQKVE